MEVHQYQIFADYFQLYLTDHDVQAAMPEDITNEDLRTRVIAAPHIVVVLAARNMTVPVTVQITHTMPPVDLSSWDHVVECSLDIPSGRIIVAGCTDYLPDAPRIAVAPGSYRARVCFRGLGSLSEDGLSGNDAYFIHLWPAPPAGLCVLKQYEDGY